MKKATGIKFTATWCGPCKRIAPTFNQLVEKVKHLVDIVIVDADEGSDICSALRLGDINICRLCKW